ncbi:MAG: hypothetical protein CMG00_05945 [Candidatus Marinimicrobia bacterium]|nr:hypothetical protein [Candidatus Neomarinimicrobiota bacterium]|tara:strand:+ start:437 stop:949 length:513 start_codon:yes stop_codon:yes gene_type:complete
MSKYELTEAKEMFMAFRPVKEIAEATGIKYRSLLYHTNKWKEERNLVRNELLKELTENKKAILVSLTGNSLACIDRAIEDLKNRPNPPSIHEARMLTNIVSEIDKIIRLDDDRPTDIIAEHKPSTVIELKNKLKCDPFYLEDANYREIANEKTITNSTSDDVKSGSKCEE